MANLEKFKALGISESVLQKLEQKGFEEPSPIQAQTIPLLIKGGINIIGQAQTGTGKTAAFGIPLAERITEHKSTPQAIILTPTRELAIQVGEEVKSFFANNKINFSTIYGGQSYSLQLRQLKKGADVVVGTPGRIIDHIKKGTLVLDNLSYFILDEADEMLNMGFIDDIKKILTHTNDDKSVLLFSATMPREILNVAKKYMGKYEVISVKKDQMTVTQTDQIYFEVHERDKFEALTRIIDVEPDFFGIVFCRTKVSVDQVVSHLQSRGYDVEGIHGDIDQRRREKILKRFKTKKISALIATDVAARGIDVNDLTHVINYALPQDPESYIHRVGRTGRAGKQGTAITFVTPSEYRKIVFFKRVTKADIKLGQVPDAKDIIVGKKARIKTSIEGVLEGGNYEEYTEFAREILGENDPEAVLSALLKINYENSLSPKKYADISKVSIDRTGKARLFIALGMNKKYDARKLVDHVSKVSGISSSKIQDVKVLEEFSFITVPFGEAEVILHAFEKQRKKGERPIISKAKEKGGSGGGGRSRGGYQRSSRGSRNDRSSRGGDRKSGQSRNRGNYRA